MLTMQGRRGIRFCDGLTRRDFLRVGALATGAVGLTVADLARAGGNDRAEKRCILLFLVGGPSQIDTWDPKPAAPSQVRGPFQPIATSVPGIHVAENFPLLAQRMNEVALVRSVHHRSAPIHETGQQLMQSGFLGTLDHDYPHYGSVLSTVRGPGRGGLPAHVVLPRPLGNTGVNISHGQGAGALGLEHEPLVVDADPASPAYRSSNVVLQAIPDPARWSQRRAVVDALDDTVRSLAPASRTADEGNGFQFSREVRHAFDLAAEADGLRERYGRNTFGQSCLLARRLVERGVRLVTVNMFDTVFNRVTWDCHADSGALPSTLEDYRKVLCPMFDAAYAALLDDLSARGMLGDTLVLALGEFGRTPHLNSQGGRDHWPGVWSVLLAGGGVRGGQVVGASDRLGGEPARRPVTPQEIAATVYRLLGVDGATRIPGPGGESVSLIQAAPVQELWG